MPSSKPLVRLHDIAANVRLIDDYMDGLDFALFKENLVRDAVERCLLRISEAAAKLGTFAEEQFPDHNWAGIRAMGNILRHEYDNVDAEIIWNLREDSLQVFLRTLRLSFPDSKRSKPAVNSCVRRQLRATVRPCFHAFCRPHLPKAYEDPP